MADTELRASVVEVPAQAGGQVFVGVDVGSASVNVVGVDEEGRIVGQPQYVRIADFPTPTDALKAAFGRFQASLPPQAAIAGVGTTGSGRELNRHIIGGDVSRTEIFAHAAGIHQLVATGQVRDSQGRVLNDVGTVIEIGGQDAKIIVFDERGVPAYFNMNSICSAGTGEFLVQIADDAGIPIADFGALALQAVHPARIDATCTVFSKRDFRHLTQKGVPLPDRLAGICDAMVHNYLTNVAAATPLRPPVIFQGGVAGNAGMRAAFERQLGLPVTVPPYHDVVGAFGMAILVRDLHQGRAGWSTQFREDFLERRFDSRIRYCSGCPNSCEVTLPLEMGADGTPQVLDYLGGRCERSHDVRNLRDQPPAQVHLLLPVVRNPGTPAPAPFQRPSRRPRRSSEGLYFAGIDGGSRGTKYALIRSRGPEDPVEVLAVGSVDTAGDAIGAICKALAALEAALPAGAVPAAVGTTGSAGEMAHDLICSRDDSADYRSTEILAHYTWASYWRPDVGTIVDIGGNDSKIVTVKPTGLDFRMNDKCAAGTGSFLEAIARRFDLPIERYAEVALSSEHPARISGRCAVFGESDVIHKARMGFPIPDLLMGVCQSIAKTYFSDVAKGARLRLPVVAQGGTFLNRAVQVAFRQITGLSEAEFVVHPDPRYVLGAGALGAALLARRRYEEGADTAFKGFAAIRRHHYRTVSLDCRHCGRYCPGVVALLEDGRPIAGYKSIDCPRGLFDGFIRFEEDRRLIAALVQEQERSLEGRQTADAR
ncbi:MAG: hypothetical protein IMW99_04670 [Firmicutes bacterium]|nr:hypothetical protein [Bacillota bacterium]